MYLADVPNYEGKIELNWMPKPRKRKTSPNAVEETGNFDFADEE
jgi:hypothetical protein